jgi:hypothetical protein
VAMIENQHQKTINGLAITYRAVDSLRPYEHNPRTHSDAQIDIPVASLKEFGWTNPILLDGKNGIIAGEGAGARQRSSASLRFPASIYPTLHQYNANPM